MSTRARQVAYALGAVALMVLTTWDGGREAWRGAFGDDTGTALAAFWDLQVESYAFALLVPFVLSGVYGLHRVQEGWAVDVSRRRQLIAYGVLVLLVVACSAEAPVRDALAIGLPDDLARSLAHYLRRSLEGVLAMIGVMVFLDVVRPGPFARLS